ncbi:hypothetical protein [Aequorivita antarctica]|uniref:Uncharacterized protein n=1 Tax=Aequorivita antarctica TaxID=153266 RepID=A0A5C6Z0C2_9FLAO|nr:hypothetical protein [Aequorivita antarctica]TXD73457.1 hypothetical protein ESU54_06745 [Aequorivita antarctica]SRX75756.1 hypothetical protein AEQU3_02752 [Aequorivita antarctica]
METSIVLAKFWGWYLLIFFFILSYNPTRIKQIFDDLKDRKFSVLVAFISIIIGLLNVIFHNIWDSNWTIIITLIGWIALVMGLLLFILPNQTAKWIEYINVKLIQVIYVLLFLVGFYLLNAGYQLLDY